jgi:hypothetical protein
MTPAEAAAYLRLAPSRFRTLGVGRVRLAGKVLYDRAALDAYLDELSGLARAGAGPEAPEAALARFLAGFPDPSRRP